MEVSASPEPTKQERFDHACKIFTDRMNVAAKWKHSFYGAAYSTRLRQAIIEARDAADTLEITLNQLGE